MDNIDKDGFEANRERDLDDILRELEGGSAKQASRARADQVDDAMVFDDGKLDETLHVRAQHRVNQMGYAARMSGAREEEEYKQRDGSSDIGALPAQIHHKHSQSIISPSKSGHGLLERPGTS